MRAFHALALCAAMPLLMANQGCDGAAAPASTKQAESQKAADAANSITFVENAEIDNIKRRLQETSSPGKIGFIMLLNDAGQPIMYASVKGKLTSSGKRLTAPVRKLRWDCGANICDHESPAPADEGTWGHSDNYVYFWTVDGQYYQWSGQYLYSDKPFRLKVDPLVISVSGNG